ncbi:PREDICTED: LOW QUALITY PROTEIN: mas-related G-protein coupled receptor MRG-like [Galeopterus variegatus]|uniref:LOW QUALITY PROTEIN: mas-related G-protein coupled receptor MRG-like n=1 Tax=Galeopterus variegatus TaxID=482537 RepID=A0ABM0RN69_GALVR|nr:PREDICTED: LOW QUALITY PROTEIN: mas-related G-protein coupled receptor MRG-like [Galeopterus variegatus]
MPTLSCSCSAASTGESGDQETRNPVLSSRLCRLSLQNETDQVIKVLRDITGGEETPLLEIVAPAAVLVSLCGVLLNGALLWLLCCGVKKSPYLVYICHLATADLFFLSWVTVEFLPMTMLSHHGVLFSTPDFLDFVSPFSFTVCLCLLVAISTERCMCVLFPIWYRCRRPKHMSTVVCTLIWVLSLCLNIMNSLFLTYSRNRKACVIFQKALGVCHSVVFFVICASSPTLLIRILCCSQQRQATKVYTVIQVVVIMFLLWGLPMSVLFLMSDFKGMAIASFLTSVFLTVNCSANPIIYFFVGRLREKRLKEPLQAILQRALAGKTAEGRNRQAAGVDTMEMPGSAWNTGDPLPMEVRVDVSK